ncbi:MAG: ribonuclease HII [Spirochaetota bacterium]
MSASSCLNALVPDFAIEAEYFLKGCKYIAGVDEAGRGSLAGPLSIGLVIYDSSLFLNPPEDISFLINDSKKLTHKKRTEALTCINSYALEKCYTFVPHPVIDKYNINIATMIGIKKLLNMVSFSPDLIIMDGNFKFQLDIPYASILKGDSLSLSIASASIVAKVNRDAIMDRLDLKFPNYGFNSNKGYGTKKHIESIKKWGISPVHRMTYEPVRSMFLK